MLDWTQDDLARRCNRPGGPPVSVGTIRRIESFRDHLRCHAATLQLIRNAFERAGVEFLNGDAPGVRVHKQSSTQRTPPRNTIRK